MYGYVLAVLVLGTVATNVGLAAPGPAPKQGGPGGGTVATKAGPAAPGPAPKNGGLPSASGKVAGQEPGGGKGSSSINGTGTRGGSASINGTEIRAKQ